MTTLQTSLDDLWQRLTDAVADRHSPFHTPSVATVGPDKMPSVRTVVLRGADEAKRTVRFHTDKRSEKFTELSENPQISLHGYDRDAAIQIRLWGEASLHQTDPIAEAAWSGSRPFSRQCYGAIDGPGATIDEPFSTPQDIDQDFARENFVCVTITVIRMEWLYLRAKGHQRCAFTWDNEQWVGQWLAP